MKAQRIAFTAQRQAVLEDFELDESLQPQQLLIRSRYSIISAGTEGASFTGLEAEHPGARNFGYPRYTGYGNLGEVIAVGDGVREHYRIGDRVFTTANHATHAKVDADARVGATRVCVKVPDGLDLLRAVFVRMADVAITAVRRADCSPGDTVLVLGAGLVGNFCAQEFRIAGCDVMIADISSSRLEKARQCGIRHCVNAPAGRSAERDLRAAVWEWTGDTLDDIRGGARIVVEAVGEPALIDLGVQLTRRHGEIILLGSPRRRVTMDVTPMLSRLHLQGLTMKGALEWLWSIPESEFVRHSIVKNSKDIFGWLADGRLVTEPLLTHVLPPRACQQAYSGLADQRDEYLGVVFDWSR